MKTSTLNKLESGESDLRPPGLREVAAACDLPYAWFTVDFKDALDDPDRIRHLERRFDGLEGRFDALLEVLQKRADDTTAQSLKAIETAAPASGTHSPPLRVVGPSSPGQDGTST